MALSYKSWFSMCMTKLLLKALSEDEGLVINYEFQFIGRIITIDSSHLRSNSFDIIYTHLYRKNQQVQLNMLNLRQRN